MFRFEVYLLDCEWVAVALGSLPEACMELHCLRRGDRCRVERLPAQLMLRTSLGEDLFFILSLMRNGVAVASSDCIQIGFMPHPLRHCIVSLKTGELVVCKVRIMWYLSTESGTIVSPSVDDCNALGQQAHPKVLEQWQLAPIPPVDKEKDISIRAVEAQKKGFTAIDTPFSTTLTPEVPDDKLSTGGLMGCTAAMQHHHSPARDDTLNSVSGKNVGALWSASLPRHAPDGLLDYFVTSTQAVEQPKAWRNLYTSHAPLLVANNAFGDTTSSTVETPLPYGEGRDIPRLSGVRESSVIQDIARRLRNTPELSTYKLQLKRKKKLQWRTLISPPITTINTDRELDIPMR